MAGTLQGSLNDAALSLENSNFGFRASDPREGPPASRDLQLSFKGAFIKAYLSGIMGNQRLTFLHNIRIV